MQDVKIDCFIRVCIKFLKWMWTGWGLNPQPSQCHCDALANCATGP